MSIPLGTAREATCPACGHHVAVPFFDGGRQPLATLAWPRTPEAAVALPKLPLDFVRCVDCGHVFNDSFRYEDVPYSEKPNLMFNQGAIWSQFLRRIQAEMLDRLPAKPVVVEIGHGDGSFLASLAEQRPGGRYVGFDPNGAARAAADVELRQELFDPAVHYTELRPDLVLSRHVLEHLVNPLGFLQRLSLAAAGADRDVLVYLEVPCVDRAIRSRRSVDFYYEHSSQFTTKSFSRMLGRCRAEIEDLGHGYDGEVIFAFARLRAPTEQLGHVRQAADFQAALEKALTTIRAQLERMLATGRRVAIWGGTGKSAAFVCRYGLDAERFPLVVDSDPAKFGTHVPGTGQTIVSPEVLKNSDVHAVIIPPQWRAADIIEEMRRENITVGTILIEHEGRLVDFFIDEHPYRYAAR